MNNGKLGKPEGCIVAVLEEPLTKKNEKRYSLESCSKNVVYVDLTQALNRDFSHELKFDQVPANFYVKNLDEYKEALVEIRRRYEQVHIIHLNLYQSTLLPFYNTSKKFCNSLAFYWPYPPYVPRGPRQKLKQMLTRVSIGLLSNVKPNPLFDFYLCPSEAARGYFLGVYRERLDTLSFDWLQGVGGRLNYSVFEKIIYIDQMLGSHPDEVRFAKRSASQRHARRMHVDALFKKLKKHVSDVIVCPHPRSPKERNEKIESEGFVLRDVHEIYPQDCLIVSHCSTAIHLLAARSVSKKNRFVLVTTENPVLSKSVLKQARMYDFPIVGMNTFLETGLPKWREYLAADDKKLLRAYQFLKATEGQYQTSFTPYLKKLEELGFK